jgi:hypothetical protein
MPDHAPPTPRTATCSEPYHLLAAPARTDWLWFSALAQTFPFPCGMGFLSRRHFLRHFGLYLPRSHGVFILRLYLTAQPEGYVAKLSANLRVQSNVSLMHIASLRHGLRWCRCYARSRFETASLSVPQIMSAYVSLVQCLASSQPTLVLRRPALPIETSTSNCVESLASYVSSINIVGRLAGSPACRRSAHSRVRT